MHFGKIVKRIALVRGYSAEDFAVLLERTERDVLELYEQEEWTSGNIKAASVALDHNFGKYLDNSIPFNFIGDSSADEQQEYLITVKYPKGKEFLLKSWLGKMALVAKAIGLGIGG